MKFRWFSTFTVIGFVLLLLGIVGLALQHGGGNFVFDPGQPPPASGQDYTPWYYLIVGALMVLNGFVTPVADPSATAAAPKRSLPTNPSGAANSPHPAAERDTITTSTEKSAES